MALKRNDDFRERPHQPTRYELIDKDGRRVATNVSAAHLGIVAGQMWPDQSQDEERSGKGWDIQTVGADQ